MIYLKNSFKELWYIYSSLQEWFLKYSKDVSLEELQVFFYTSRPGLDDKQREIYDGIFQAIQSSQVETSGLLDLVKGVRQRENLQSLAVKSFEASEGRASLREIEELTKQLLESQELPEVQSTTFVSDNLNELYLEAG